MRCFQDEMWDGTCAEVKKVRRFSRFFEDAGGEGGSSPRPSHVHLRSLRPGFKRALQIRLFTLIHPRPDASLTPSVHPTPKPAAHPIEEFQTPGQFAMALCLL